MTTDRERRARLEQLQSELRSERALAVRDPNASLAALEAALGEAQARAAAAQVRADAATAQRDAAEARQRHLVAAIEEARVLALGAKRRDKYVDWAPSDTVPSHGSERGAKGSPLLLIGPVLIIGVLLVLSLCGR